MRTPLASQCVHSFRTPPNGASNRGDILNLNLTDLANSLKFPIIWDVVSGEKIKFDVALREHEAQGTLFFTK